MIRGIADLSQILPTQWLLEDVCPDLFYAKLAQRDLLMPRWRQPSGSYEDGGGEVAGQGAGRAAGSESARRSSMRICCWTRRERCATATAGAPSPAAWLWRSFARAMPSGRGSICVPSRPTWANSLPAVTADDFHAIVRRVIELPNSGQTRIQNGTGAGRVRHPRRRAVPQGRHHAHHRRYLVAREIAPRRRDPAHVHRRQSASTDGVRANAGHAEKVEPDVSPHREESLRGTVGPGAGRPCGCESRAPIAIEELRRRPGRSSCRASRPSVGESQVTCSRVQAIPKKGCLDCAGSRSHRAATSCRGRPACGNLRGRSNLPGSQATPSEQQTTPVSIHLSGAGETMDDSTRRWQSLRQLLAGIWQWLKALHSATH